MVSECVRPDSIFSPFPNCYLHLQYPLGSYMVSGRPAAAIVLVVVGSSSSKLPNSSSNRSSSSGSKSRSSSRSSSRSRSRSWSRSRTTGSSRRSCSRTRSSGSRGRGSNRSGRGRGSGSQPDNDHVRRSCAESLSSATRARTRLQLQVPPSVCNITILRKKQNQAGRTSWGSHPLFEFPRSDVLGVVSDSRVLGICSDWRHVYTPFSDQGQGLVFHGKLSRADWRGREGSVVVSGALNLLHNLSRSCTASQEKTVQQSS